MTTITDWRDGIKNAYNSVSDYFGVKLAANSGVDIGDVDVASIAAGTNLIGHVTTRATGFSVAATLTVTNGAYTAKDVAGGLITLAGMARANAGMGVIQTITLGGVEALAYDLWFLTADIATPAADNAAFTIVAADEALVQGVVPIAAADYYKAESAFNLATLKNVGLYFKTGAATTSLYAYLVAQAITSPGTDTLYLKVEGEFID